MPRKELISGEWKKVCSRADCHKAGIPQPIEGFSKAKSNKDGLQYRCKKCRKAQRARPEIKAHIKAKNAAYHANNRERILAQKAEYRSQPENKARKKARDAEYRSQPENKARTKVYNAEYRAQPENKERTKAYNAEYKSRPEVKTRDAEYRARPEIKERRRQRKRDRYHSDPAYRVKCNVSNSIYQALKTNGWTKGGSTFDHLPYSPEGLAEHLEKQFDEHMTWDNHGTYWHIDHIRPHASFNYDSLYHPEFQECWALENLRPLKASENISKGSFYEGKRHYYSEAV